MCVTFAPPLTRRPRRKITALSYSCTTWSMHGLFISISTRYTLVELGTKHTEEVWVPHPNLTQYFVFKFGIYFCCDLCLWLVNWNSVSQLSQSQAEVAAKVDTKLKQQTLCSSEFGSAMQKSFGTERGRIYANHPACVWNVKALGETLNQERALVGAVIVNL